MKKLLSLILVLVVTLSLFNTPLLAYTQNDIFRELETKKITDLLTKYSNELSLALLEENNISSKKYNSITKNIESQLSQLGVEKLSEFEVYNLFNNKKGINPELKAFSIPKNTNTVTWYSKKYSRIRYNGEYYDVQWLTATGKNSGGMLTQKGKHTFFTNKQFVINSSLNILSIYAQKAIGTIPIVNLLPYELGFPSGALLSSSSIEYGYVASLSFFFVKKSSQSDDYYNLSLHSSQVSLATAFATVTIENGSATPYTKTFQKNIRGDYYDSYDGAIKAFRGHLGKYHYVSNADIYSYDKKFKKNIALPSPLAGPGQVY